MSSSSSLPALAAASTSPKPAAKECRMLLKPGTPVFLAASFAAGLCKTTPSTHRSVSATWKETRSPRTMAQKRQAPRQRRRERGGADRGRLPLAAPATPLSERPGPAARPAGAGSALAALGGAVAAAAAVRAPSVNLNLSYLRYLVE